MRFPLPIAIGALLLAGCAGPLPPIHGVAAATVRFQETDGRVAAPGIVRSGSDRDATPTAGLSLDLLQPGWLGSFRSDFGRLPSDLESPADHVTSVRTFEAAAGPNLVDSEDLRLDLFAGARLRTLRVSDSPWSPPSDDTVRQTWVDPLVGVRAEWKANERFSFRVRGDSALGNSGSEHAWRASAAAVFGLSESVALSFGWETSSVQYEDGSGGERILYDVRMAGPFLAFEVRF